MSNNKPIRRVAIIGTGVIGASWSAQFLAKGLDVIATDIAPDAETSLRRFVKAAWPALERLGLAPGASQSRLTFTADLQTAVREADFVQENGPERIEFKKKLYRQLDELLAADVIIASSSSGLTMSEIQSACDLHPDRCVIGHPFNPPHLVPLVEIVGGAKTSEATIERAAEFYTGLGKQAVRLRKEVPGHVANRLQAALAREVYYLVAEGVVSAADVDTALCWGPGLRWGIMGTMTPNHLSGGAGPETVRCGRRSDRSAQSSHLSAAALPGGDRDPRACRDRRAHSSDRGEAAESHGDAGGGHGRRSELTLGQRVLSAIRKPQ